MAAPMANGFSAFVCLASPSAAPSRCSSSFVRYRSRLSSRYFLRCLHGLLPSGRNPHSSAKFIILLSTAETTVRLIRAITQLVVELGDISPEHVGDAVSAQHGLDERSTARRYSAAVLACSAAGRDP